jgi:hypothetical protein
MANHLAMVLYQPPSDPDLPSSNMPGFEKEVTPFDASETAPLCNKMPPPEIAVTPRVYSDESTSHSALEEPAKLSSNDKSSSEIPTPTVLSTNDEASTDNSPSAKSQRVKIRARRLAPPLKGSTVEPTALSTLMDPKLLQSKKYSRAVFKDAGKLPKEIRDMDVDTRREATLSENQLLEVMAVKPEVRRQFLNHFSKHGDLLAKHRPLIETQVKVSKNKSKDLFEFDIKKSLWRNYATAKTAQENPDSITAGGLPRIRAPKKLADLHSATGKFAAKDPSTKAAQPTPSKIQTVEEIIKGFQAGGRDLKERMARAIQNAQIQQESAASALRAETSRSYRETKELKLKIDRIRTRLSTAVNAYHTVLALKNSIDPFDPMTPDTFVIDSDVNTDPVDESEEEGYDQNKRNRRLKRELKKRASKKQKTSDSIVTDDVNPVPKAPENNTTEEPSADDTPATLRNTADTDDHGLEKA